MRTLIFDFDGTICDSFFETLRVMNELAPRFGYNVIEETSFESLRDQGPSEIQAVLGVAAHKIPALVLQGRKRLRERMLGISPVPHLPEALRELRKLELQLGILTSNSRENVELFLERNDLRLFDFVHGGSSLFGKARLLKKIMRQRGLKPEHVTYIGDEARDVKAAAAAGVASIAVSWGFNSVRLLKAALPDFMFSHPRQLLEYGRSGRLTSGAEVS